jgi:rhamnogalacturonan endolyase
MFSISSRMSSRALLCLCVAAFATSSTTAPAQAQEGLKPLARPQVEKLDRGMVALVQDGKPFISWRLFPGEEATGFNLYRASAGAAPVRLNRTPLLGATNFIDTTADLSRENRYFVRSLSGRREASPSAAFVLKAGAPALPYLPIRLQTPPGYAPNDLSTADLDGDGQLDFVLHQVGRAKDNSQNGVTDPPILQGYKLDGTLLWTINLGKNIRDGAHYTQFMVYDLDGDGRAEVMCKTADGTVDGQNKVIGDPAANYVNESGRILSGPEYLSVFDGRTGAALTTTNYLPRRHPDTENPTGDQLKAIWGDGYGNRNDRFLACIAYLDGIHPSVVMCRGYYTRTVLAAWDFRAGKLSSRWVFDTMTPGNEKFAGQGNHNLSVGDVDGDGKDEIVYGKMAVDDDGKGMYSTGIGHGDAMHLSDLDPSRPGLEVFSIQESFGDSGLNFFDARTGEVLWKKASLKAGADGEGPARGLALDIDPRTPGAECWGAGAGMNGKLFSCKGTQIGETTPSCNMGIYWDGDPLAELLDGTTVSKWDWQKGVANPLLSAKDFGCVSNNGTKANPALVADILGDWREEVIYRSEDNGELRVFVSTVPTNYRLPTLMSDHIYRMGIAWQNVAYNQPPHLGYDLVSRLKWSAP